jgi:hypothetical protein
VIAAPTSSNKAIMIASVFFLARRIFLVTNKQNKLYKC